MKNRNCTVLALTLFALGLVATQSRAQSIYTPYAFTNFAGQPGVSGSTDGIGQAAQFYLPHGVALDSATNLYVADTQNQVIRRITPAGVVTTIAGRVGNHGNVDGVGMGAAQFNSPIGLSADSAGNLYVGDMLNRTIRQITPGGVVTTLAGSPGLQGTNDGVGTAARFNQPVSVAVDSSNNVYVSDSGGETIRKIDVNGVVTTLAGTGGLSGTNDG